MTEVTLYGIRTCDSVRRARRWLDARGIGYRWHDLREDGVPEERLRAWCEAPGWERILNRRSTTWRQLPAAARADLDPGRARALMAAHPTLIRRPVLEADAQVLVGFDEQAYRQVLGTQR